ncbi:hypothetical protein LTR84_012888 [Exophiala bonariae]|uniref:Uncharacterized protein n=1 Tax=Exophiala bonariae TaxID=1690606 RepID=A0AAV9NGV1_9EURO|nr:hypothetical protein LTR84_012888 [Exophiala bonariae]
MATFDFARLSPALYDMKDVTCVLDFQLMVQDFMNVVRTNPGLFENHDTHMGEFCTLLECDDMWQVAYAVVPEFRLRQDHELVEDTLLNAILRTLSHKRPRVPVIDPGTTLERNLVKKRFRTDIEYLESLGLGFSDLDEEGQMEMEDIVRRTLNVLED